MSVKQPSVFYRKISEQNPVLSIEQQYSLIRTMRDSSLSDEKRKEAREKLILSNIGLAIGPATSRRFNGFSDDAIQDGLVALIESIDIADPESVNGALSTYARIRVNWKLKRTRQEMPLIRIKERTVESLTRVMEYEKQHITPSTGEEPTENQIIRSFLIRNPQHKQDPQYLNWIRESLRIRPNLLRRPISLDKQFSKETDDTIAGTIPTRYDEDPSQPTEKKELHELLRDLLPDDREYRILTRFYGIGKKRQVGREIGKTFGISKERVRQIKDLALEKLRTPEALEILEPYLS